MATLFTDFTTGEHEGRGTFDELMRTAKSHLLEEFEADRISKAEYTQMYIQLITATMGTASQFTLQLGITNRQEELLAEQALKVRQDTLNAVQQGTNLAKEALLADAQLLIKAQELINITQQNLLAIEQTKKVAADVLVSAKQLLIMDAQLAQAAAETATEGQKLINLVSQELLIDKQSLKMTEEIALLVQKTRTEEAQILDTVNGNAVTGVIGRQKTLYEAQEAGFARDAEQKLLKFMSDNWALRLNSDPITVLPSGFSNTEIDKVLAKAKLGVGIV